MADELSISYEKDIVEKIFKSLRSFLNLDSFTYNDLYEELKSQGICINDIPEVIESLFLYSLIELNRELYF